MTNLTIHTDDKAVRQARIRALQDGASLNAQVALFLQRYVHGSGIPDPGTGAVASHRILSAFSRAATTADAGGDGDSPSLHAQSLREWLYDGPYRDRPRNATR